MNMLAPMPNAAIPRVGHYIPKEYPKQLNCPGRPAINVNNEAEEKEAKRKGYSENPLGVPTKVDVSTPMTSPTSLQAAYDALKKQYEETVTDFNIRYRELEDKFTAATIKVGEMVEKIEEKNKRISTLTSQISAKNAKIEELRASVPPAPESVPADPNEWADGENPFKNLAFDQTIVSEDDEDNPQD